MLQLTTGLVAPLLTNLSTPHGQCTLHDLCSINSRSSKTHNDISVSILPPFVRIIPKILELLKHHFLCSVMFLIDDFPFLDISILMVFFFSNCLHFCFCLPSMLKGLPRYFRLIRNLSQHILLCIYKHLWLASDFKYSHCEIITLYIIFFKPSKSRIYFS